MKDKKYEKPKIRTMQSGELLKHVGPAVASVYGGDSGPDLL